MTLSSPYSTEQLYREWINGTPISEIVNKTGIKRKTWNKRFERYEKQLELATNNSPKIINGDKTEIVATVNGDNGDISQIMPRNVANNNGNQNRTNKLLKALAAIAAMIAIYLIYMQIKKGANSNDNSDLT